MRILGLAVILLAQQSYVPPPPPHLPEEVVSKESAALGKELFERNVFISGKVEIYNYLGKRPCLSCHDEERPLKPQWLAENFKELRTKINTEITQKSGGIELPLEDPAMEAMVHYLVDQYDLHNYKLLK